MTIQLPDVTPTEEEFEQAANEYIEKAPNARELYAENLALRRVLLQATSQIHNLVDRGI